MILFFSFVILFAYSRATIMCQRISMVRLDSYQSRADVYFNSACKGSAPSIIHLNNQTNHTIEFKKEDYKPVLNFVNKKLDWVKFC